ncbi:MAG: hypothetical protein ACK4MU_09345, partial [Thermomonas sp.]
MTLTRMGPLLPNAVTGTWFLDAPASFTPPEHVARFLAAGEPPVCVNFGSMMLVEEGGATDTFAVHLNSRPWATVTVHIEPSTQLEFGAQWLAFSMSNWRLPQTVVVTAIDDDLDEGFHQARVQMVAGSAD